MRKRSDNETCCFCCPLVIGITLIKLILLAYCLFETIEVIIYHFNEYVDWWFPVVLDALIIPMWVGMILFWCCTNRRTKEERIYTLYACIIAILTAVAVSTWNICYFLLLYKKKVIYLGYGDSDDPDNYSRIGKVAFIS